MKDFLGNELHPSDLVAYSSFEGSDLSSGIVVKLTAKMVRILPDEKYRRTWRSTKDHTVLRDPLYVVKIGGNGIIPEEYQDM